MVSAVGVLFTRHRPDCLKVKSGLSSPKCSSGKNLWGFCNRKTENSWLKKLDTNHHHLQNVSHFYMIAKPVFLNAWLFKARLQQQKDQARHANEHLTFSLYNWTLSYASSVLTIRSGNGLPSIAITLQAQAEKYLALPLDQATWEHKANYAVVIKFHF